MHDRSVNGILYGRKVQTRRVIKDAPEGVGEFLPYTENEDGERAYAVPVNEADFRDLGDPIYCPYGDVGDTLWVREAFKVIGCSKNLVHVRYRATDDLRTVWVSTEEEWAQAARAYKRNGWSPSIYHPRWAARILLRVTDIRCERVQAISAEDCLAEGIEYDPTGLTKSELRSAVLPIFERLWNDTNSHRLDEYGWDENPWVWIIEFEVL